MIPSVVNEVGAWALLRALAQRAREGSPIARGAGLRLDEHGRLIEGDADAWIVARPQVGRGWAWPDGRHGDAAVEMLFDLYMPLCVGDAGRALVVGHLA